MARRQFPKKRLLKCDCCGRESRDIEHVGPGIHPQVKKRNALICSSCFFNFLLDGEDHKCQA
jgi:hypothetical protein